MKKYYIYNKNTGEITEIGINHKILYDEEHYVAIYDSYVLPSSEQYHDLETNKLTPRPTLNIEDITLIVDQEYNPPNIPSGTIVNVDDEDVGIVDNTGLILVFPVAKTYKLQLKPPFPYFEKTITIEVITEWLK